MEHAETVVEYTISALREAIREGRFAPGQRLVVADVTRAFGVSAGPVREAIRRLTGEGLIDIVPHRGATVREFTLREIREIFELREVVEGLAARTAARRIEEGDHRKRLEASRDEMIGVVDKGPDYVAHNQSFHALLYEIAGNGKAVEIATQLTLPIYRMNFHRLMDPAYARTSMDEHEAVVAAILAGDEDRAEIEMRRHIRHSGAAMIEALDASALKPRRAG
jgi:DNA-binding GntR family transcriptional regulator